MQKSKNKGISFYELIIVMTIIGIISAIAIPSIRNYLPSWRLSSSVRAVSAKLRQAQEQAVSTQQHYGVLCDPVNLSNIKLIILESGGAITDVSTLTLHPNISRICAFGDWAPGHYIYFNADGSPSRIGTITLTETTLGASKQIEIKASGLIKIVQ